MITPCGLDEITHLFGNLDNPRFEAQNIVTFKFPYPMMYDGKVSLRSRCHKLMVPIFTHVFTELVNEGLDQFCKNHSGIYNARSIRGQLSHPSTHSWGIAIDLEAAKYPLGSTNRFPDAVIKVFADAGFTYGGNFRSRKDPMHFQFARNY